MQAYIKYHHCSLYSSLEMNLNIMVEIRIDANVDGLMDKWTDGWKTGSLYCSMLKTRAAMTVCNFKNRERTPMNIGL